jgi:murein DD-endopeptidase MepM/ murein hydrolase activator NlpD
MADMAQDDLIKLLARLKAASPVPFALNSRRALVLNLGRDSASLEGVDPANTAAFGALIAAKLRESGADYAVGGYGEDRPMYRMSDLYGVGSEEPRSVHLGIDLWLPAGTPVHAVLPGVVHSTRDNKEFGDYGPTIIMAHEIEGIRFHTLYGHLSRRSLLLTPRGRKVGLGEPLGWLGEPQENVGWPPHLHFQVIRDLDGREGDYPGVCRASEQATWLARCPDPNMLMRVAALKPAAAPRRRASGTSTKAGAKAPVKAKVVAKRPATQRARRA